MSRRRRGYRHVNNTTSGNRIRVRGTRLDHVDEIKLTMAYRLLVKELLAGHTNPRLPTEAEVQTRARAISDEERDAYHRGLAS